MTPNLQSGVSPAPEPLSPDNAHQFVVFALSGQRYALDIMTVREIRMVQSVTRLPGAAEFVRGIINLRGTIVPIFDLRMRFGLGETNLSDGAQLTVVIADVAGSVTGLLVDEVLDILTLPGSAVAPVPSTDATQRNPYFKGLASKDDEMMIVVDLDQSVPVTESGAFGRVPPEELQAV